MDMETNFFTKEENARVPRKCPVCGKVHEYKYTLTNSEQVNFIKLNEQDKCNVYKEEVCEYCKSDEKAYENCPTCGIPRCLKNDTVGLPPDMCMPYTCECCFEEVEEERNNAKCIQYACIQLMKYINQDDIENLPGEIPETLGVGLNILANLLYEGYLSKTVEELRNDKIRRYLVEKDYPIKY